ncbi:pentapeptide repeat-containing protein [Herbidospora sp. RD11066]
MPRHTSGRLSRYARRSGLILLAVAFFAALIWIMGPGARWILDLDRVGLLDPKDLATAVDAVRGRALAIATGIIALIAVYYTARNAQTARDTFALTEQAQVTDRYTKAIQQLGDDKLDIRLGGIYALERIAHDSERDHNTIQEVLTTFIRVHSHDTTPDQPRRTQPQPDIQAAITVIGRSEMTHADLQGVDLTAAKLTKANLKRANLTGANLTGANLGGANLNGASLTDAHLISAHLNGVNLAFADLTDAHLTDAHLNSANLTFANLTGANLNGANLDGANLGGAHLKEASLNGVNLDGADLGGARLNGAHLNRANLTFANLTFANLTGADLTGADLTCVNLTGADLTGADLTGVNLTGVDLSKAVRIGAEQHPDVDHS